MSIASSKTSRVRNAWSKALNKRHIYIVLSITNSKKCPCIEDVYNAESKVWNKRETFASSNTNSKTRWVQDA